MNDIPSPNSFEGASESAVDRALAISRLYVVSRFGEERLPEVEPILLDAILVLARAGQTDPQRLSTYGSYRCVEALSRRFGR